VPLAHTCVRPTVNVGVSGLVVAQHLWKRAIAPRYLVRHGSVRVLALYLASAEGLCQVRSQHGLGGGDAAHCLARSGAEFGRDLMQPLGRVHGQVGALQGP
jgi:hypothetical protein